MDIVHLASECAPIAKVGGLGDVIYGLSRALVKKGHAVRIFLPKYDCIDYSLIEDLKVLEGDVPVSERGGKISSTLFSGRCEGLNFVFVEPHHAKGYFERGTIYGEEDDNDRFLFFCKVSASYLQQHPPDVVHMHDWEAAGMALFLKNQAKTVFTIHNLQYQGRCAPFNLENLDLEIEDETLRDYESDETLNLMRGALAKSAVITTVSPAYREEILTAEYGCGLEGDLTKYKKKLMGILNGIDTDYWNPGTDALLAKTYTAADVAAAKKENKAEVQQQLSLEHSMEKPLVVAITRLVPQKGPDLLLYGIEKTLELGGQFVLLGSSSSPEVREDFLRWDSHPDIAIELDHNEPLAHKLYAGSDMLLMPSIFEPCGLAQLIAMRYGSIPLVRKTGGLKDTVCDGETGLVFDIPDNRGVASVLERAFTLFQTEEWLALIKRAMETDFSWERSAGQYIALYEK